MIGKIRNIVILGCPRAGTHYLMSLFNLNGYSMLNEVLNWRRMKVQDLSSALNDIRSSVKENDFSVAIVHDRHAKRVIRDHESLVSIPELLNSIFQPCAYIHLERDVRECVVSNFFAQWQRRAHSTVKGVRDDSPPYNHTKLIAMKRRYEAARWSSEVLIELGALTVTYDEICELSAETKRKIYDHTGCYLKITQGTKYEKLYNTDKYKMVDRFKSDLKRLNTAR